MKRVFWSFILVYVCYLSADARQRYINPVPGEMPILAWYSIRPDSALTAERYQEMKEAGFNISFSHFADNEEVKKALDASRGTGVKIMVMSGALENNTAETVNRFKRDEGVAGWFLRDEPTSLSFPQMKAFRDRILQEDTTHMLYLNLLPVYVSPKDLGTTSYREYLKRFVDEVDLGFFSYDNYPIVTDGKGGIILKDGFFTNLEDALAVSRETGVPFWAFALSTAHGPYPVASREMLRLEMFSNLAYGAQGLQYFTYWNPGNGGVWNFHTAPISLDGARTHVYYLVKELNEEIHLLTPVFLGAEVMDVSHFGSVLPPGTHRPATLPAPISQLECEGKGMLISHLKNGKHTYCMVLNTDINHTQTLKMTLAASIKRILPGQSWRKIKKGISSFQLAPGDYVLLQLS